MQVLLARCLAMLLLASAARADIIAPAPVPERVARAKVIVVGKVTSIEPKTVKALPHWGGEEKVEYQVAVVKVEELLLGEKGLTHVKVGYLPGRNPRRPRTDLEVGQELCLFLTPHPKEAFYLTPMYFDQVQKTSPAFAKEVELTRRCAKFRANPDDGLGSKNAGDRFLTAAMLVLQYRTLGQFHRGQAPKTEPIPAAQSKRILLALAEADWGNQDPALGYSMTPLQVFFKLGDKKDWKQPADFAQIPAAAKKWIMENAETYRIQRFVTEK